MENLSPLVSLLFGATTLLTVWLFYKASNHSKNVLYILIAWLILQMIISLTGFYQVPNAMPPRFLLLIGPALIISAILFITHSGKKFIDQMDLKYLTLLHAIRIPVEFTLFYVYLAGMIPVLMTFEGNNLDIISGLSAPIIYYLVFIKKKLGEKSLLIWNFICLGLLINVLTIAILSAQTPLQQLAFDQPNIGVTYFPFVWLPAVVVPIVFFSHLVAIRQLIRKLNSKKV